MNQATPDFSEQIYTEQSLHRAGPSRFPLSVGDGSMSDSSSSSESGPESGPEEGIVPAYHPSVLKKETSLTPGITSVSTRPPPPPPLLLHKPHHRSLYDSMADFNEKDVFHSSNTLSWHDPQATGNRYRPSAGRSPLRDRNHTKRFSTFLTSPVSPARSERQAGGQKQAEESNEYEGIVGQEPGVDVKTMDVELPGSIGSQVTIIDYSPGDCKIAHYDVEKNGNSIISGSNRQHMLQKSLGDVLQRRPEWCKVRWIVVNGLSWEAIKPITLHFKLHPLAVEDMLDIPQRTKMEVFEEQLFCCYPLHVLSTTQTPYSITHVCIRYLLLCGCRALQKACWCLLALKTAIISCYRHLKRSMWMASSDDIESNPHFSVSAFSEIEFAAKYPGASLYSSTPSVSTKSTSSERTSRSSRSCYKQEPSYIRSCAVNARESVCSSDLEEEVCIPFYTINHGVLCGDAYSSSVAEKLRQMPPRSLYDWGQGNDVLKKEALQNMHIQNTALSHEITSEQVSLFMVGDTVITFFEKSGPKIYGPLENRLKSHDTMLRHSSDPEILVQAILDASVDLLGPILNAYRTRLSRLQVQGIQQPNLQHTRALHAFMTDLAILRPPLSSIASLVNGLWSKCTASRKRTRVRERRERRQLRHAHDQSTASEPCTHCGHARERSPLPEPGATAPESAVSDVASLYFRDVADHAVRYLQDLDDMRNQSVALSSLVFNTISIHGSDYMKMLSLVSVVFLPLTFLTGYFGMNFKTFAMLNHDVEYYWVVAAPAAAALCAFVMYSSTKYQLLEIWARVKAQL